MKKYLKVIIISLGILLLLILCDSFQAKVFNNRPILSVKKNMKEGHVSKGILVDFYSCGGEEVSNFKWDKHICKKRELVIYDNGYGKPYDPSDSLKSSKKVLKKIKTETFDAKVLSVSNNYKYVLFKDGSLKILNYETDEIKNIDLEDNYEWYKFLTSKDDEEIIGIVYYKDKNTFYSYNKAGFYNINNQSKLYEDLYSVIVYNEEFKCLDAQKTGERKRYFLNIDKEEIIREFDL